MDTNRKEPLPMTESNTTTQSPVFAKDEGTVDLWWPYGPVVGRYTIKASAAQSQGSLSQILVRDSRGAATPMHIHLDADETFYVIEGEMTAVLGDERFVAHTGDYVFLPRGVPHCWVVTSERIEMLITCGPAGTEGDAGSGIDGFFREVAVPVVEGEAPPEPTMPDNEHFARRMLHYGIQLVGPPPAP
jgi:quercetin dioxygenase-like cupin family protein